MQMHAISLWQPWATLLAHGKKKIETRSWAVPLKIEMPCLVAIHATKTMPTAVSEMCLSEPFASLIRECGYANHAMLPMGSIVGVGRLVECRRSKDLRTSERYAHLMTEQECGLGDYRDGRFGWIFDDLIPLPTPIKQAGSQGIWQWDCPAEVEALLGEI